jgi:hypothetical protein
LAHSTRASVLAAGAPIDGLASLTASVLKPVGPYRVGLVAEHRQSREHVAELRRRGADVVVMFRSTGSHQPASHTAGTAGADVIVVSGAERAGAALERGAIVVAPGKHGEDLSVVRLRPGAGETRPAWRLIAGPLSAGQVHVAHVRQQPLDATVQSDLEIRKLLDQLFARINARHAAPRGGSIEAKRPAVAPAYVGARTCAACHTGAYLWWAQTRHASAFQTLIARGRQLDLDCIGCHVTGFEQPGGAVLGRLGELKGVGCESCHGPGGAHVDNPQAHRTSVHRMVPEAACVGCHDPSHSDAFVYAAKRAALIAPGHGAPAAPHQHAKVGGD